MVQLEQHVILVLAAAAALLDLLIHGARHDIARREVLQIRCVALHEALAIAVEQNAALAPHALGDQHAGAGHGRRMELPELHVFERDPCARCHPQAVAGVDEGIGAVGEDATCSTGRE